MEKDRADGGDGNGHVMGEHEVAANDKNGWILQHEAVVPHGLTRTDS